MAKLSNKAKTIGYSWLAVAIVLSIIVDVLNWSSWVLAVPLIVLMSGSFGRLLTNSLSSTPWNSAIIRIRI